MDGVGSCVGQKGVRVQSVINELGGLEKIDIVQWSEDIKFFIQSALAPAKDIDIITNDKKNSAQAFVPDDQLSLAIGREGQNVRLAAKLTGWKIDIIGKSEAVKVKTSAKIPEKVKKTAKKAAKTPAASKK